MARRLDPQVLLRDLRPDRRDVLVGKLVDDEAADEARLPHGAVAEEEDLSFDMVINHGDAVPCGPRAYNACWLNVTRANTRA